jgi:hypothetical protein
MIGHFQTLLAGIITDHKQRLSELRLLTDAELEGVSPSDFASAKLSQKELENLILEISEDASRR